MRNDGPGPGDRPGQPPGQPPGQLKDKRLEAELGEEALLPSPAGPPHAPHPLKDDPDAPPTEEERRLAAALREALSATEEASPEAAGGPKSSGAAPRLIHKSEEGRWLAAHLRLPSERDSLGEVRARGLARAAREALLSRRAQAAQRDRSWRQLGRTLGGTGALLAAAAALLIVSWGLLDQGARLQRGFAHPVPRTTTALLLRTSLQRNESPTQRLDLMLQERLQQLRAAPVRTGPAAVASRRLPAALQQLALSTFGPAAGEGVR